MDVYEVCELSDRLASEAKIPEEIEKDHRPNFYVEQLIGKPSFLTLRNALLDAAGINNFRDIALIEFGMAYAWLAQRKDKRISGGPAFGHDYGIGMILAFHKWDAATITGGLLHDCPEKRGEDARKLTERLDPQDRPVYLHRGIPEDFRERFCSDIIEHLTKYVDCSEERLEIVYDMVFQLTRVEDHHYFVDLEAMHLLEAHAGKLADSLYNTKDIRAIDRGYDGQSFSTPDAVANTFKALFNIHYAALGLKRNIRSPDIEKFLDGYIELCLAACSQFGGLAESLSSEIQGEQVESINRAVEKYRGTELIRKVTVLPNEDETPFRSTINARYGQLSPGGITIDDPSRNYQDCRIAAAVITDLYTPASDLNLVQSMGAIKPIRGLNVRNLEALNKALRNHLVDSMPE